MKSLLMISVVRSAPDTRHTGARVAGGAPVVCLAVGFVLLAAPARGAELALLKIGGDSLPAMKLGDSARVREGQMLAFTAFPIRMVLGFHPATHRGMVAAITPVALPRIADRPS